MLDGDRPPVSQASWAIALSMYIEGGIPPSHSLKGGTPPLSRSSMGLVRLKIRELAAKRGWTIKEVAHRSGVNYNTVKSYARHPGMNMVDLAAVQKIARAFDISIEDLVEVLEE